MVELETHDQLRVFIAQRQTRLKDVETRGVEALSRYDREVCYQGDEQLAIRETLRLLTNQIGYAIQKLAELGPSQASLF